ncbi:MAG: MFS transporter [Tepidisphaeraceae bacterium]
MAEEKSETINADAAEAVEQIADQALTSDKEAAPPLVPPPGVHPLGYEPMTDGRNKVWRVGTLVYTTGALAVLFCWLLFGDFAIAMRDRSVQPLMQLMLKGFDASNLQMAVLLSMIPTAITLVLSPIVSYKSDRMRSRWGRRIPFLLIPTPIAAVAMIGLAFCPQIAHFIERITGQAITHKTALLAVFALFWTAFEIAVVVSGAVFNGLINDVVPRPVLGRFFGMFRAVSLIDGMIFNWFILGHAEDHFTLICWWIAIVFGVGFTLMCVMVKEGDYPEESHGNVVQDPRTAAFCQPCGCTCVSVSVRRTISGSSRRSRSLRWPPIRLTAGALSTPSN